MPMVVTPDSSRLALMLSWTTMIFRNESPMRSNGRIPEKWKYFLFWGLWWGRIAG